MSTNGDAFRPLDGQPAAAVERPASLDALRDMVGRRADEGLALYPQGGATAWGYGRTPRKPGVVVDLRALDGVVDYPAGDMTITVEAGMTLGRLQEVLAAEGQRLPIDPPFPARATLGGIWATACSGPRRLGWGRARDMILGVRFVTSEGAIVKGGGRVVKNVAGYDFPRLLTGSLGSLGIIAEMTLKVRPRPEATALALAACATTEAAGSLLDRLNHSLTRPAALELLNAAATARLGGPFSRGHGMWTVAVGFEDNRASVAWQVEALAKEVEGAALDVIRDDEAHAAWNALADHPAGEGYGPVSLTANVRPSAVAGLAGPVDAQRWAVQAHAGSGIVHLHLTDPEPSSPPSEEVDALRAFAVEQGGNLIVARCPTPWKDRLRPWGEPRGDWPLMERIKRALDPRGLMNPGRFVGNM